MILNYWRLNQFRVIWPRELWPKRTRWEKKWSIKSVDKITWGWNSTLMTWNELPLEHRITFTIQSATLLSVWVLLFQETMENTESREKLKYLWLSLTSLTCSRENPGDCILIGFIANTIMQAHPIENSIHPRIIWSTFLSKCNSLSGIGAHLMSCRCQTARINKNLSPTASSATTSW